MIGHNFLLAMQVAKLVENQLHGRSFPNEVGKCCKNISCCTVESEPVLAKMLAFAAQPVPFFCFLVLSALHAGDCNVLQRLFGLWRNSDPRRGWIGMRAGKNICKKMVAFLDFGNCHFAMHFGDLRVLFRFARGACGDARLRLLTCRINSPVVSLSKSR